MKTMRKLLILIFIILSTSTLPTLAATTNNQATTNNLNVTVHSSLPIAVDSTGNVVTATTATIENNGNIPVYISSINVIPKNGWKLVTEAEACEAEAGSKVIAFSINGSISGENGIIDTSDFGIIGGGQTKTIDYDAVIPIPLVPSNESVATAIMVIKPVNPVLETRDSWYKGQTGKDKITEISLVDSYNITGDETESWDASTDNNRSIMCYINNTTLTIAGCGIGKITANKDSSNMFNGFINVTEITGLNLLDTSTATDISSMFSNCTSLKTLDLNNFDTSQVENTTEMFSNCINLETIYTSSLWSLDNLKSSSKMFNNCLMLTGGNGTTYNQSYTDSNYARIDTTSTPGYLTAKIQTLRLNSIEKSITGYQIT